MALLYKSLDINLETMQGMCYSGKISSNTLIIEEKDLKFYGICNLIKIIIDLLNNCIINCIII